MKFRLMKAVRSIGIAGILLLAVSVSAMRGADAAEPLSGTIYGVFDYQQMAWVGHVVLRLGDGEPLKATFKDVNTSLDMKKNGMIMGTETITVTFLDGSGTFEILAQFTGVPGPTPNLYTLHEVGKIANGTGKYKNLSGQVSVRGPFLFPDPGATPGAPPWIAEMHGVVLGLE